MQPMAVVAVIPNRLSLVFHCERHTDDDPGMRNETDSIPDTFLDVLTPASRVHNHNIRFVSNLNYFRPRVSTNLGKTSFKFSAPKIWETVPPGLKCLPYHKFKKEWKSCLLTNQI